MVVVKMFTAAVSPKPALVAPLEALVWTDTNMDNPREGLILYLNFSIIDHSLM